MEKGGYNGYLIYNQAEVIVVSWSSSPVDTLHEKLFQWKIGHIFLCSSCLLTLSKSFDGLSKIWSGTLSKSFEGLSKIHVSSSAPTNIAENEYIAFSVCLFCVLQYCNTEEEIYSLKEWNKMESGLETGW